MKEMTEKEVLERKILLNQQAYCQVSEFRKEHHREQIRILRRRLWELNDQRTIKNEAVAL